MLGLMGLHRSLYNAYQCTTQPMCAMLAGLSMLLLAVLTVSLRDALP